MFIPGANSPIKNTSYKVVLPFYAYAALSYLVATILMLLTSSSFTVHYFNPHALSVTHLMALGWGTMIILGASHQLFPVMIEGKLHSNKLAHVSFILAAVGIPFLVYAFHDFNMGWMAQVGSILVNSAVISYMINLGLSIYHSKSRNVHAIFAFTAVLWLLLTTLLGLLLVGNFSYTLLSAPSLAFLSLHAHFGIIGWFLLMVIGVGSRLIPMFLISKYENKKQLWLIYLLVNSALITFVVLFFLSKGQMWYAIPIVMAGAGILLFAIHIYKSYTQRIRKKIDDQVRISMLSVGMALIPFCVLMVLIILFAIAEDTQILMLYGFTVFFGWLTAIILGMTFKTLPFIVWNKVYSKTAGLGKTPNPKELFDDKIFTVNAWTYLIGFLFFAIGIVSSSVLFLNLGALFLLINAVLYNFNVFKIIFHKSQSNAYKNK